jgi:predicted nucleic acid-binding Zn ribbon protein
MRTWRQDIRPFATVTEDGAGGAKSAEARLAEIQALRQTDKKRYWSPDVQAEELRLIEMLERNKARATA